MRYKIVVEYNGKDFFGWQRQAGLPSVQEALENALEKATGKTVVMTASGRTDAGVHALGQVVSFDLETSIPTEKIPYAVNVFLPSGVRILACEEADSDFNARFDAKRKTYLYKMYVSPHLSPLRANSAVWLTKMPDVELMKKAAKYIVGTHDFKAMCSTDCTKENTVRTIFSFHVRREGELVIFTVSGDGFLYNMVRIMVGTLIFINEGKIGETQIPDILASKDRTRGGKTVPPQGLYLNEVYYDKDKGSEQGE